MEQLLNTIKHLPTLSNPFTRQSGKNFAIYVLDNFAVHLMPEVRKALLKKGYILVLIGGGITGNCQINDTHYHCPLKANYRKAQEELMLQKLRDNPD